MTRAQCCCLFVLVVVVVVVLLELDLQRAEANFQSNGLGRSLEDTQHTRWPVCSRWLIAREMILIPSGNEQWH